MSSLHIPWCELKWLFKICEYINYFTTAMPPLFPALLNLICRGGRFMGKIVVIMIINEIYPLDLPTRYIFTHRH